jgi:hypothetical protein
MDLVLFAGPVILRPEFSAINWLGRSVKIVAVEGAGSTYFSQLAEELRDSSGRILPNLIRRYAGSGTFDQVALCAYSAGHGLLNKVGGVAADRARLSAMVLDDACFSGYGDPPKAGYVAFGLDAARGDKLMVVTASNSSGTGYQTGRASWLSAWRAVEQQSGLSPVGVTAKAPAPAASGGWWRLGGGLYWGDYVVPGAADNTGNDFSHADHHNIAPRIWQAYLAPYLARPQWLGPLIAGSAAAAVAALGYLWWRRRKA